MPTYRKLHTKILDSYDFSEMPNDFTRVFWMLLIVTLDSEGRAINNPAWLRSRMFPLRDDVTNEQITDSIDWLSRRSMVIQYEANGRSYFYVPNFKKYQSGTEKEAKSVLPAPPTTQELVKTSSIPSPEEVDVAVSVSASVYESDNAFDSVNASAPNIYAIYEKNVGALTPMLSDKLDMIENEYPPGWFADAVKEAVGSTTRVNLNYIEAILKRWKADGRKSPGKNGAKPRLQGMQTIQLPDGTITETPA